jgi:hypothetical protein
VREEETSHADRGKTLPRIAFAIFLSFVVSNPNWEA